MRDNALMMVAAVVVVVVVVNDFLWLFRMLHPSQQRLLGANSRRSMFGWEKGPSPQVVEANRNGRTIPCVAPTCESHILDNNLGVFACNDAKRTAR